MESIQDIALRAAELLDDKKGRYISVLDVQKLNTITDFMVIASGTSDRHVMALADHVEDGLEKAGFSLLHKEGHREGRWIVLDFVDLVVHIFQQETRDYYSLERIWRDARPVELKLDSVEKSI